MEIVKKKYQSDKEEQREFFFTNYKKGEKINVTKTAQSLGVSRRSIYNWMAEINNQ